MTDHRHCWPDVTTVGDGVVLHIRAPLRVVQDARVLGIGEVERGRTLK
jgi:hypothetical protein